VIQNFKIVYDDSFDFSKDFPAFFNLSFREFDQDFNIQFEKVPASDKDKAHSYDIYVINKKTGHPVKHSSIKNEEQFELYKEKGGSGSVTMIKNKKNGANRYRIVTKQ
jgi:hypothetical protein